MPFLFSRFLNKLIPLKNNEEDDQIYGSAGKRNSIRHYTKINEESEETEITNLHKNINLIFWIVCMISLTIVYAETLKELIRISQDNDASLKEEYF